MNYRGDIDGLRAVAVLMVVLYHFLGHPNFNGYVGVDIFFVISGYLITRIISENFSNKNFKIVDFYERRARRIMPALIVVLTVSTIMAYCLFLPRELLAFAKSLISAVSFSSNIFFLQESGYFDMEASLKPLLHTWSLAVEEQFYLIYPLLIWGIFRYAPHRIRIILVALMFASFAANIWWVYRGSYQTSFYMLPMRAWEFLVGALLGFGGLPILSDRWKHILGSIAFVILLLAFGIEFDIDRFPGVYAVAPVLGATLTIYSGQGGQNGWFNKFLALSPLRFIGKISYSLYLWHWPVYVFVSYYLLAELEEATIVSMLLLSFSLAYLSWRFIEEPWRKNKVLFTRSKIFGATLISAILLSGLGVIGIITNGALYKFNYRTVQLSDAVIGGKYSQITIGGLDNNASLFTTKSDPIIAIWGDSHALAFAPAVEAWGKERGTNGLLIQGNNCFLPSEIPSHVRDSRHCLEMTDAALKYFASTSSIQTVILANRWAEQLGGWIKHGYSVEDAVSLRFASLKNIIGRLRSMGKNVVLIEQVPQVKVNYEDVPSILARMDLYQDNTDVRPTISDYLSDQKNMMGVYKSLEEEYPGIIFRPREVLCDKNYCSVVQGNFSLYYDDDHLSRAGAQSLLPLLDKYLKN